MTEDTWAAVDRYIEQTLIADDAALAAALHDSETTGLPGINLTPPQAKLLHLLARIHGAKRILEIGTLGGYSTIWLARALPPGGRVITIEVNPDYARIAERNLARAGVAHAVELKVGAAADILPELAATHGGSFDLIFIDADKPNTPTYLEWALKLSRPGTLLIVDNVVRSGAVADPQSADPKVQGMQRSMQFLSAHRGIDATAIQTVGAKGYDGFAIGIVTAAVADVIIRPSG